MLAYSSIEYIDSLFICVSGVTGTGLATVDLSALTLWQQFIIVIVSHLKSGALHLLIGFPRAWSWLW